VASDLTDEQAAAVGHGLGLFRWRDRAELDALVAAWPQGLEKEGTSRMSLVARAIPPGSAGVDTTEVITPAIAAALRAEGKRWIGRYALSVTAVEVGTITSIGLGLVLFSYGRQSDFSAATGAGDATAIIDHLKVIGVPLGGMLTIILDLETPTGATIAALKEYEAAFAGAIAATGCTSGVYLGAGLMMTSAELYALKATRYAKSGSRIVDSQGNAAEPQCGYVLVQGLPFDQPCGGAEVDFEIAFQDFEGRSCWALYSTTSSTWNIPIPESASRDTPTDPAPAA
jgi:hypothetical protein